MAATRFFGIDLGTSTCSVSYAVNSARPNSVPQPVVVAFRVNVELGTKQGTKSDAVPSVVVRSAGSDPDTPLLFGFAAEEAIKSMHVSGPHFRTVFRSVKSHLGTGRSYVRADPSLNTPVKVWSALIRHLCEMTVAEKGADFDPRKHPTVLTVPASFGRTQRDDTLAAAKLAGFDVDTHGRVQLIDEPVAALIDTLNSPDLDVQIDLTEWKNALVFDFGGGTCDLFAFEVRYDATKASGLDVVPLSISPYQQLGGDTIDLAIMEVVWSQVCEQNGIEREQLTANERKQVEDTMRYEVCRELKILVNEELAKLSEEEFENEEWDGVSASVTMGGAKGSVKGKERVGTAELTADDLHNVMLPFLELNTEADSFRVGESQDCYPFATLVELTLNRAGMSTDDLDLVVLHGGSCYSPFIPQLFDEMREQGILKDSCKVTRTPDLTTSVAKGAALYGCLSAKQGKPYISPIVSEDMSFLTEGGTPLPVVSAGTQLPVTKSYSGKDQLYLSEAGQREIVIPIYVGYDDDRRRASTLTFPIAQKRLPQSHPVEAEITIDTDKISRWRFRPVGYDWCEAQEVANPWIGEEATEPVEKLQAHREAIRATLDKGGKPTARVLADEAYKAALAGLTEEGLRLIEDVIHENPEDANAWNMMGLIHGIRREERQSAECHEKASVLAPDNLVFRGNHGVALHRTKRYAEAVDVMREALSRSPGLTYLHSWLADAFRALNDPEEMRKELERWHAHTRQETVRNPEAVEAWEALLMTSMRLGKYDEAEEAREEIRELKRDRNLIAGPSHG